MSALPPRFRKPAPRRVLVLSYHFPPSGEVAGKPTARLVRHLPAFGWEPVVLTIPESDVTFPFDRDGYADVLRATRVEKVARWLSPTDGLRAAVRLWKRGRPAPAAKAAASGGAQRGRTVKNRLISYLTYPDLQAGWVGPAVRHATRLLRREPFDALLTVAPPHSVCLAGWLLRRRFPHVRWVAQMHDPWTGNPYQPAGDRFLAKCTAHLERRVVRRADAVCLATDDAAAALAARYPEVPADRFWVLYNGYDPADFPPVSDRPTAGPGPIRFVYTGSLYAGRDPFPFLRALSRLIADGRVNADDIRVELIGDCAVSNGVPVRQSADALGLSEVVTVSPPVSYSEALRRLAAADVLLLFAQHQPDQIPAKAYEYLHLDQFVLAFTDGATGRLLRETAAGQIVGPGDDAEAALADVLSRHRAGLLRRPATSADHLRRYQADHLAGEFAGFLDRLIARRPGKLAAVQGGAS